MTRRLASATWILALLVLPLRSEIKVLKGFTLIDGTGRPAAAGSAMIVDNGRIRWVGPARDLNKAPAGAEVLDLSGTWVMPGIINLHGHVGNTIDLEQNATFFTRENIERNLKAYAAYGVTAVLSMGTDQDLIFKVRDEQRAGRPSMARVYTAGQGFVYKGGYGGLAGVNAGITAVSEVKPAVAAQARKKVDIIKLWMDDHLGDQKPRMPYPIARAIIDEAHRQKLRVAAHVFYLEDAKELISDGVDGLAHSVRDRLLDSATLDLMKKKGTWQMAPTLSREASLFVFGSPPPFLEDPFFVRGISSKTLATLKSPQYQTTIRSDPHFSRYPEFLETGEGDWPHWRGPNDDGMARGDAPLHWSDKEHIAWKAAVPGRGFSSPVVWGDRIFVTTAVPTGTASGRRAAGAQVHGALLRPQDRKTALGKSGARRHAPPAASSAIRQLRVELADHRWQAPLRVLRLARPLLLYPRRAIWSGRRISVR